MSNNRYTAAALTLALAACASGPGVNKVYDYEISDMSSASRPDWLDSENIVKMNEQNDGYRYYIGENDNEASKATKALCRTAAEMKARYDFASAIETAVKGAYREVESSSGHSESISVKSNADLDRALNVDKNIGGAEKYKDYWEQRSHKKEKGAPKDYKSYYCMALVRMKNETYAGVVQKASDKMVDSLKLPADVKKEVAEKAAAAPLPAPSAASVE